MSVTRVHVKPTDPYVGPRAFEEGERLYGRDQEVRRLVDLLIAKRIVLLYAPSGAGKTSLIQAKLVPALAAKGFFVLPVARVKLGLPATVSVNGHRPANRYVLSALHDLEKGQPAARQLGADALSSMDLPTYFERHRAGQDEHRHEVLVFDQFEEILTVDPVDLAAKREFFDQVGAVLENPRQWALFSMREDYIAGLAPYLAPIPTRLKTTFRLDLLDGDAAGQAIRGPALEVGVDFTPAAIQQLVDDLRRVQAPRPDGSTEKVPGPHVEPVQLQVVCRRLWQALPPDTRTVEPVHLKVIGDIDQALAGYYRERIEQVAVQTGVDELRIRAWFSDHLITGQGIRGQALQEQERSAGLENTAIAALVDAHIVRGDQRRGATWFELAHDRLIEPIQRDNAAWFDDNLSPLQRQARLWDSQNRDSLYLFDHEALVAAESWLKGYAGRLTEVEEDFLKLCREREWQRREIEWQRKHELALVQERERLALRHADLARQWAKEQRRAGRRLSVVLALTVALGLIAWTAAVQARLAGTESRDAAFGNLAARLSTTTAPGLTVDHQDDVAALMARQAYRFDRRGNGERGERVVAALNGALAAHPFAAVIGEPADGPVRSVAISRDGRLLAAGGDDGMVRLWDIGAGRPFADPIAGAENGIFALAFSPDGHFLAVGGCRDRQSAEACAEGVFRVWNVDDLDAPPLAPAGASAYEVRGVAFHPTRPLVVWGGVDGTIRTWDLDQPGGAPIETPGQNEGMLGVAFHPDGRMIATAGEDGAVLLFDPLRLAEPPTVLTGPEGESLTVAFDPSGRWLAAGSADKRIWLWDIHTDATTVCPDGGANSGAVAAACSWQLISGSSTVTSVSFRPDNGMLVSATYDGRLRFWNPEQPARPLFSTSISTPNAVVAQAFRAGGDPVMATGSTDGLVRLWDFRRSAEWPRRLYGHPDQLWSVAFSPDPERPLIASGGWDDAIRLWDVQQPDAAPIALPFVDDVTDCDADLENCDVWSVTFSGDGRKLAAGYGDGAVRLWDDDHLEKPADLLGRHADDVRSLAFSPDGRYLVSGGWDSQVLVWDLDRRGADATAIESPIDQGAIRAVAFSPDGRWLAAGGCRSRPAIPSVCESGGLVLLWDWQAGGEPSVLCCSGDDLNDTVYSLSFSPDSERLAVGSLDGTIQLWDIDSRARDGAPLSGHGYSVRSVPFLDEDTLISASDDGTVRRWDLSNRDPAPAVIVEQGASVHSAVLSPDRQMVVSGDASGFVRVSFLDPEYLADLVCERVTRDLTVDEWNQHVGADIRREPICP